MKGPSKIGGVLKRLESAIANRNTRLAAIIPVTSYYGIRFLVLLDTKICTHT